MLQHVSHEAVQPLLNQRAVLELPDGQPLPIEVQAINQHPRARLPEVQRMPFSVMLRSLESTAFIDGLCNLDLPDGQRLQQMFVSREPAMGRDEAFGYFNIVFS